MQNTWGTRARPATAPPVGQEETTSHPAAARPGGGLMTGGDRVQLRNHAHSEVEVKQAGRFGQENPYLPKTEGGW